MIDQTTGRAVGCTCMTGHVGLAPARSNKVPFPMLSSYTASKGGIDALTKVAAVELGAHGIRVNCVAPGPIETEMVTNLSDKAREIQLSQIPLGRLGRTEDVTPAVAFLAGDDSSFITGEVININGGLF